MPDPWLPGASINPGVNANYRLGKCSMDKSFAHFTVGRDSRGEGVRGYFNFLVHQDADRENGCTQYAEVDAITWHAFGSSSMEDAPDYGPGIEYERMVIGGIGEDGISEAEPLTENQIAWGRRIIEFCAEFGVQPNLYNGPRYEAGDWHGWINHRDIDKDRSDGLTQTEWELITHGLNSPAKPIKKRKGDREMLVVGNMIEAGQPNAGKVLQVLYDTQSGVECGRVAEEAGPYGFGATGSSWISQGALANLTDPLSAYIIGTRMYKMAEKNGAHDK